MKRLPVTAVALVLLGLGLGILVSRWFVPDHYGWVTMFVLFGGGLVVGAMLGGARRGQTPVRAGGREDSAVPTEPSSFPRQFHLGATRVTVRWQPNWKQLYRTRFDAELAEKRRAGSLPGAAVLILLGAVGFALLGQWAFIDPKRWAAGLALYAAAIVCFVLLVWLTERAEDEVVRPAVGLGDWQAPNSRGARVAIGLAVAGAAGVTFIAAPLPWNQPQNGLFVIWLAAALLYLLAFVPWLQLKSAIAWFKDKGLATLWAHRVELVCLGFLVAVGFVLRYWHLASIPGTLGGDEGEMGAVALDVRRGALQNPFITGWLSHPTLFFFLQALSLDVFGPTVYGLRLLSVFGGTASILVTYLLVRRLFDWRLALLTAALLTVYNFHIQFSRLALNNIFDSVFAPLVFLLFYAGIESRRPLYFAAGGGALGLALYFYHGARLIPVIVVLFGVYLFFVHRQALRENLANLGWMALGALVVAGPLLYYFELHPNDFMARLTQRGIFQSGWFAAQLKNGNSAAGVLAEQVRRSFLAFNAVPDPTDWFGTGLPLLDPVSGMLLVFGVVYALGKLRHKGLALFVIWLGAGIVFGSTLLENPPTSPSFVILAVPALFFVALGLSKLLDAAGYLLRPLARLKWQIAAGFCALFALWSLAFYFLDYTPRDAYGGTPNRIVSQVATLLQSVPQPYRVYFVTAPYMYYNIGSRKFLMADAQGQDVIDPVQSADDLAFVQPKARAVFVFTQGRAKEIPVVQEAFPNGRLQTFADANGKPLFYVYEAKPALR